MSLWGWEREKKKEYTVQPISLSTTGWTSFSKRLIFSISKEFSEVHSYPRPRKPVTSWNKWSWFYFIQYNYSSRAWPMRWKNKKLPEHLRSSATFTASGLLLLIVHVGRKQWPPFPFTRSRSTAVHSWVCVHFDSTSVPYFVGHDLSLSQTETRLPFSGP